MSAAGTAYVAPLRDFGRGDVARVGGKNASLGEMLGALEDRGVRVPGGVAVTVDGFAAYVAHNGLADEVAAALASLDEGAELRVVGSRIRKAFGRGTFPGDLEDQLRSAYRALCEEYGEEVDVAVRSSATAEDLPDASFAGQQETLLNVTGEDDLLRAVQRCYTSLYTDRAIHYRAEKGYAGVDVGLSVAVQKMVRSGSACSGVLFTLDPDTGFPDVVVINGAWGSGRAPGGRQRRPRRVGGAQAAPRRGGRAAHHRPRPRLQAVQDGLRRRHHGRHQGGGHAAARAGDVRPVRRRGAAPGRLGPRDRAPLRLPHGRGVGQGRRLRELFVVQARPETVQSRAGAGTVRSYALETDATPLVTGIAIGGSVASGRVRVVTSLEEGQDLAEGDVLVTEMTDPTGCRSCRGPPPW